MKTRFASILDFIVTRLLIFSAVFVWARYFVTGLLPTFLYSLMITAGISVIITTLTRGKKYARKQSFAQEAQKRAVLDQFLYGDSAFCLDFFYRALSKQHKVSRTLTHLVVDGEVAIFCRISLMPLTPVEYCECLAATRRLRLKKAVVLTQSMQRETARLAGKFPDLDVYVYEANAVYALLQKLDTYPEIVIKLKENRAVQILPLMFNRTRTRSYMMTAMLMLFATFFMPQTIYYAITTTLLILMATASQTQLFAPKQKNSPIL